MIRTVPAVPPCFWLMLAFTLCPRPTVAAVPDRGQLDADPALFTVMAAVNAAGVDADLDSPANHPLRQQVRDYLKTRDIPSLVGLKAFVAEHRLANSGANLAQYISYALSVEGPPDFRFRYKQGELSPDVVRLQGFSELLTAFWKESDLGSVWSKSQPAIDKVLETYQEPVSRGVMQANAYLRNPTSGYLGRRFQIFVDLLAPPNQVHTRSFKDDYFVVVTPAEEVQADEIRHAYLHYLMDPLVLKYSDVMARMRDFKDLAEGAPALPDSYKTDFTLLTTECLIKAVEARLLPASARQAVVDQALVEGFVLTPAFAEGLVGYEKQEQALRLYFPDLVKAIDLNREERRLESVQFVSERAVKTTKATRRQAPKVELTGPQKALEEADGLYRERKLIPARDTYARLLETTNDQAVQSRAYYGLARIAVLQNEPENAEKLFRRTLELNPDAEVRGWSWVYLGRLYDAQGDRERAAQSYRAALSVEGVTPAAREAAQKGFNQSFSKDSKEK